jgi:hypothetical protein
VSCLSGSSQPLMSTKEPPVVPKFTCETEAAALLNCVAGTEYVEHKCVALMKRLRKCIQVSVYCALIAGQRLSPARHEQQCYLWFCVSRDPAILHVQRTAQHGPSNWAPQALP